MAAKETTLNLTLIDTHSSQTIGIADLSYYQTGHGISSPTLEVEVPGYGKQVFPFVKNSLQIINSEHLGITCEDECLADLPDGIYKVRYSIYPAYKYYVDKTFLRVENLWQKFDKYFLTLELDCRTPSSVQRKQLEEVELYIQGAIAAANNCATKLALELYQKADKTLDALIKAYG